MRFKMIRGKEKKKCLVFLNVLLNVVWFVHVSAFPDEMKQCESFSWSKLGSRKPLGSLVS